MLKQTELINNKAMKKLALRVLFVVAGMLITTVAKANFEDDYFGKYSAFAKLKKANATAYNLSEYVTAANGHGRPLSFARFFELPTIHSFSERWDSIAISDIVTAGTTMNAAVLDGATLVVGRDGSGSYKVALAEDISASLPSYAHLKLADGIILEIGEVGDFPITMKYPFIFKSSVFH